MLAVIVAACTTVRAESTNLYVVNSSADYETLAVSGLRLTFSGGYLVASSNGSQVYTASLSSLDYMTFTEPTGIDGVSADETETVRVYNAAGCLVGEDVAGNVNAQNYPHGVYILKSEKETRKIVVK